MTDLLDFQSLFDALSGPAFVVSTEGVIERANRAAIVLFGKSIEQQNLHGLEIKDVEKVKRFLRRSSGSRQGSIGVINLRGIDGAPRAFRCKSRLLRPSDGRPALLFIDCSEGPERFSILAKQVRDLNTEMRKRCHVQAVLEESLRERELLMRELHHRVRNNLQMVSGMLGMARSEIESPEAKSALTEAASRVSAIAAVQQVFYNMKHANTIPAAEVIQELCASLAQGILAGHRISLKLYPLQLSNDIATPLALILNELLTNAVKYGGNGRPDQEILVQLAVSDGELVLSVQDQGPGFDLSETGKRASGLGLVRGLARAIGGKFEVKNQSGACCIIRVKQRSQMEAPQ